LTFYYSAAVLAGHWGASLVARRQRVLLTAALLVVGIVFAPVIPVAWLIARWGDATSRGLSEHARWMTTAFGVAAGLPILFVGALRATGATMVYPRHMLMALPGFLVLLAIMDDQLPWPRARAALWALPLASFVACLIVYEARAWQVADWRGAAHYVASHTVPGDRVLVAPPYEALPFEYYYPRPEQVVPIPVIMRLDSINETTYQIRDTGQLAARFAATVGPDPFWLVESKRPTIRQFGQDILEQFVAAHYRVETDTMVLNVEMRRLVPR
jgi:hypothetical protein